MTILVPPFMTGSYSFLPIKRTTIKAWMCSIFGQIPSLTLELDTLERLKNRCTCIRL